jgi:hypothetical protein
MSEWGGEEEVGGRGVYDTGAWCWLGVMICC